MRKILTILPVVLMLVLGALAGDWLHRQRAAASLPEAEGAPAPPAAVPTVSMPIPEQFFVPIVRNGSLRSVMVLGLGFEVVEKRLDAVHAREFQLRDALLRRLMIHANTGGFDGNFTSEARLAPLRERLQKAAQASTDLPVKAVLIEDIARQAS